MIWDFPTIKDKVIVGVTAQGFPCHKSVITRRPWIRIIWGPTQKTILLGKRRINFTAEQEPP